jgi:diguanylate cyclase (GGDEF)-like protein
VRRPSLRRRPEQPELFASERPPRLVLRFAFVLSLALGLASAAILLLVHHFALSQAEQAATRHAGLVASALLQREVRRSDLAAPVPAKRRAELDAVFAGYVLSEDVLGIALVRSDGLVTYATDRAAIGTRVSGTLASEAAGGTIASRASAAGAGALPSGEKALETFAPVAPDLRGGSALITQPYAPIERAARTAQLRIGGVLEGLLVLLFLVFVPLLARVTQRIKRQIERIHFQAFYDGLTELPNRAHLFERLERALERAAAAGRTIAVLLLDLNRFREINDTLGHDAGDALLRESAARLRRAVGGQALLARLSGDEFAVIVEYAEQTEATALAESIAAAIEPPVAIGDMTVAVDATVGIAYFPEDGRDAEALLKHAEVAMYTAKEWRVGVLAYSPAVDPHDPERLKLATALRKAAEEGQLRVHYQPKIDLASRSLAGFEALAYWSHPTRGLLPPGAFIPVAERNGTIRHVTGAVLRAAAEQLREWSDTELTIAVNLTAIDLLDTELADRLQQLLDEVGADPGRLCVELTESTVMADPERALAILSRIAGAGVRVSIDDFGTGHSSLAYLKDLPVHEVKIDRSFVSGMALSRNNRMIVKATIQLVHSLGLQVVAEGVEDGQVDSELRGLGCDYAQGYLYGRPQPVEAWGGLLATLRRRAA